MAFPRRPFAQQRNFSSSQTSLASKSEPCLSNLKNQSAFSPTHLPAYGVNFATDRSESRQSQDGLRFMLFRECDIRGRKLLYDTAAGSSRHSRRTLQLMDDMIFGSAALNFHGDTVKLHDFSHEHWEGHCMMLTKIFLAQPVTLPAQTCNSIQSHMSQATSCATDSGFTDSSSFFSSLSSLAPSSRNLSAVSATCESSTSLVAPKAGPAHKAASDSLLPQRGGSKGRSKKLRLAFSLLVGAESYVSNELNFRDLILHHFSLVEVFLSRLQFRVLQAFYRGPQCVTLLDAAFQDFLQNCANVWSLPSLNEPAWLCLTNHSDISDRFLNSFAALASLFDTKFSQFFFSSLLTAVLTYHVTWVHSFVKRKSQPVASRNRILLLTQDAHRAGQFISVLSYFVRCPDALQLYDDVLASRCVNREDIPRQKKTSSSSMEIRNAAVGAVDSRNYRQEEVLSDYGSPSSAQNSAELAAASNGNYLPRRRSQQPENLRYLKDYFDARYAAEKSHVHHEDFGSFKNAIMRGSFQELTSYAKFIEGKDSDPSSCGSPNFFVGSIPESVNNGRQNVGKPVTEATRVEVPSIGVLINQDRKKSEFYCRWHYGKGCNNGYVAGRTLQALDSRNTNWLDEVRLDLCAAACLDGSASCLIANVDTCEIQLLTCEMGSQSPLRLKEHWSAVSMSGAVSSMVESTQMMWEMSNKSSLQCIDYIESRLKWLVQKSEELSQMLTSSVNAWTVKRIVGLLGVEEQDLPLLLAACSVHSPHITQMVGLSSA